MKEKVGETAGKIWNLLYEKGEVNISKIPKSINEKSTITNQAIGWLAREDKISYRINKDKIYVSLINSE